MAPASGLETLMLHWLKTYFLSSRQPLPSSAPLEIKFMQRLVDHLCFYTLGVVTPPLSMVLANYKYFQIMHRYVVVMRYEVMV